MTKKISIPWLHRRTQKSGQDYYYVAIPNSTPRQEIAVGPNLEEALVQRQILLARYWNEHPLSRDPLVNLLLQYQNIHAPLLDTHFQRKENLSSLENLVNFFSSHRCLVCEIESPLVAQRYLAWRNPKLSMRARSELSLLKRVVKVSQSWHEGERL